MGVSACFAKTWAAKPATAAKTTMFSDLWGLFLAFFVATLMGFAIGFLAGWTVGLFL